MIYCKMKLFQGHEKWGYQPAVSASSSINWGHLFISCRFFPQKKFASSGPFEAIARRAGRFVQGAVGLRWVNHLGMIFCWMKISNRRRQLFWRTSSLPHFLSEAFGLGKLLAVSSIIPHVSTLRSVDNAEWSHDRARTWQHSRVKSPIPTWRVSPEGLLEQG